MAQDTRHRMVRAAMELLCERGYSGTSFGDVMALGGAPRGSIYHHFPGGKQQLAAEAIELYSQGMVRRLTSAVESGPATRVVAILVDAVRDGLRASDFRAGCAVAAVTLDATPAESALLGLTAEAFASWRGVLAKAFRRDGATAPQARRLAALVVSAVEGAMILARADHDVAPISDVGQELDTHLRTVLPGR